MTTLTITSLLSGPFTVQDATGLSTLSITVPGLGTVTQSISTEQLEALTPALNTAQTAGQITWTAATTLDIKTKYMLALINRVHMLADLGDIGALIAMTPLSGGALQSDANARANALQALMGTAHLLGLGTIAVDGEHQVADTTNSATLLAIPAATNLTTCETLTIGLATSIIAHGNQVISSTHVHFHDDTTSSSGSGWTPTNPTPDTLAKQITNLNDIRQAMLNHFSLGSQ